MSSAGDRPLTPFFILSSGRSGSTLLASMLTMHPAIHVPVELFGLYSHLPRSLPWYGDLRADYNRRLLARDLSGIGQLAELGVAFDERGFAARLADSATDFADVVRCFYATLLAATGKSLLVDKTPNHSPYLPLIERLFPEARIIHLVRDGRDCAASSARAREGINQRNVQELGTLWPRNNLRIADFGARRPQQYLRVRFEDLLTDPRGNAAKICAFLGQPFDEAMLRYAEGEFARTNTAKLSHHANVTREILGANQGRWREAFTPEQVCIYESLAGEALVKFGYPLASHPATMGSRFLHAKYSLQTQCRRARRALRTARVEGIRRAALLAKRARQPLRPAGATAA